MPDPPRWCPTCGLNLRLQEELPTPDAYAARKREERWFAHEGDTTDDQARAAGTEAAGENTPESGRRVGKRTRILTLVSIGLVIVLGVAAWAVLGSGILDEDDRSSAPVSSEASVANENGQRARTRREGGVDERDRNAAEPSALESAVRTVEKEGFRVTDEDAYQPDATLRVLIGEKTPVVNASLLQAFFFVEDDYIGTDFARTSPSIEFVKQSDTTVALRYPEYAPGDPLCCPSGTIVVRFTWDGEQLTPDSIPATISPGTGPETMVCEPVVFTPNSDDATGDIEVTGVSCEEARTLVAESGGEAIPGYDCTTTPITEGLAGTSYRCELDAAVIVWDRF